MANSYNPKSAKSILKYGQELLGHSLKELHPEAIMLGGKGGLGKSVEKFHYGYEPNNEAEPYFIAAGLELKCIGLIENKREVTLPTLSNKYLSHRQKHFPSTPLCSRLDILPTGNYRSKMFRNRDKSSPHSLVCDNVNILVGSLSRIHRLHLRVHHVSVAPRQIVRRVVVACSLFNPPFAVRISFNSDTFGNGVKRPVAAMHEASIAAVPIPIVSRTKMVA